MNLPSSYLVELALTPISATPKRAVSSNPCFRMMGLAEGSFFECTSVFDSFDLTLSITAMEGDPMVLREPQHRCRGSSSRLRIDKTVTPCAPSVPGPGAV